MGLSVTQQDLLWYVVGLVVGLPVLVVALGEVSERLAQQGNPLAQGLRQFRNLVVPLLAVLYIMRYILGIASSASGLQLVETVVHVALIVFCLTFIRNLVRLGEVRPASWLNNVPRIFFALARVLVLLVIVSHVLASIWQVELSRLSTALGVGSLVMALALQDTLSNLVSGFLLLADHPFKVGDWCEVGGKRMQVQEVGWRTTRFASFETRGLLMFPNGSLGKEVITNFGQEGSVYTMRQRIGFSYDDPPNRVKHVLMNLLLSMDEVMREPPPRVTVLRYQECAIEYRMDFVIDYRDIATARDNLLTQLYYTAKRHNLTIPLPIRTLYHVDHTEVTADDTRATILNTLQAVPLFRALPFEIVRDLAAAARLRHYGAGEHMVQQGATDDGLYVVQSGRVTLATRDQAGQLHEIAELSAGDVFGEMALLQSEPSPFSATVSHDAAVLVLDHDTINSLVTQHIRFASEMNSFIEERRRVMYAGLGPDAFGSRQAARDEVFDLLYTDTSRNGE